MLLYPDYANENGNDTYFAQVETADATDAFEAAQQQASEQNDDIPSDNFALLAIFDGYLDNLA